MWLMFFKVKIKINDENIFLLDHVKKHLSFFTNATKFFSFRTIAESLFSENFQNYYVQKKLLKIGHCAKTEEFGSICVKLWSFGI